MNLDYFIEQHSVLINRQWVDLIWWGLGLSL